MSEKKRLTNAEISKRWRERHPDRNRASKDRTNLLGRLQRQRIRTSAPQVLCACGCGGAIPSIRYDGATRTYVQGHKGRKFRTEQERSQAKVARREARWAEKRDTLPKKPCECGCGARIPVLGSNRQPVRFVAGHQARAGMNAATRFKKGENTGESHHHWHGGAGKEKYPKEFNRTLRKLVRIRDNYTCQRCGITQEQYGRTMGVHHIDHDKQNLDLSNLMACCNPCNLWYSYHRDEPVQRLFPLL